MSIKDILITTAEYRPCYVGNQKALFHKWELYQQVVSPSPLKGGHNGGTIATTYGIVEYEDGRVDEVPPSDIRFVDNKLNDYCFSDTDDSKDAKTEEFSEELKAVESFREKLMDEFLRLCDYNDYAQLNLLTIGDVVNGMYNRCIEDMVGDE